MARVTEFVQDDHF
jgi:hypothetical protein